mmetsp:Transcript_18923/g.18068  ORF Transcript_18923/g.18068 Transcript_18923/m.18068 type:complete len:96 (-) Transcript_18923:377-664(-)
MAILLGVALRNIYLNLLSSHRRIAPILVCSRVATILLYGWKRPSVGRLLVATFIDRFSDYNLLLVHTKLLVVALLGAFLRELFLREILLCVMISP